MQTGTAPTREQANKDGGSSCGAGAHFARRRCGNSGRRRRGSEHFRTNTCRKKSRRCMWQVAPELWRWQHCDVVVHICWPQRVAPRAQRSFPRPPLQRPRVPGEEAVLSAPPSRHLTGDQLAVWGRAAYLRSRTGRVQAVVAHLRFLQDVLAGLPERCLGVDFLLNCLTHEDFIPRGSAMAMAFLSSCLARS